MTRDAIAAALIVSVFVTALPADTVELVTGDLLHGTVTEQTDEGVSLSHPVLGDVVLPQDQVKDVLITPAEVDVAQVEAEQAAIGGADAQADADASPQKAPEALPKPKFYERILPKWDKSFEVGLNGSEGNTQNNSLVMAFNATYEDDFDRWALKSRYFRKEESNDRTENELDVTLVRDWLEPESPWFTWSAGQFQYDEFEPWETRTSGFIGKGKVLNEGPKWGLEGRAGIGGNYENGDVNDFTPEALFRLGLDHEINERQNFTAYGTLFPDLDDNGESRVRYGAAWKISIDEADGLSLKLGLDGEYESVTVGSSDHNDMKYYATLVFDF